MKKFRAAVEKFQRNTVDAAQKNIPAGNIINQVRGAALPPSGPSGTGYPPADTSVTTGKIADNAVTFAKMQDIATDRLIGRDTAGTGDPEALTVTGGLEFTGSGGIRRSALTGDVTASAGSNSTTIPNDTITYAKMQNVSATARLLGRATSGAGDVEEITIGSGLSLSGTTLSSSGVGGSSLTVEEVDGSPTDSAVTKIVFPNSTLSITSHVATYTPAAPTPAHAYYAQLCALLEPGALEPLRVGTGSVTISSGATKYLILGWALQTSAGRLEIRDPRDPLPLRNITISGIGSSSTMILLDPSLPTYTDAWTLYHDRLLAITELDTKIIEITGGTELHPFLPGPYGAIITGNTIFNLAWVALRSTGLAASDLPLNFELGDANTDWVRFGQQMRVPITKMHACAVESGAAGGIGAAGGSLTYVQLPSTWSVIADPNTYIFRDDFMGASLDTSTVWTRAQSTTGNVEIDTNFSWCKLKGDGSWGDNGLYSQSSTSRAAGKVYLVDLFIGGSTPNVIVGWHDGAGQSYTNFIHGVYFDGSSTVYIFESGSLRGAVGSGYSVNTTYRVRITLGSANATYAIQGGPEYPSIGGASWTTLTPGTPSSSTTTPLHAGASIEQNVLTYVGDMRVY